MINRDILKMFESHTKDPSFTILIRDIKQTQDCGQEAVEITVDQINKSINKIEEDCNIVSKKLNIRSELGVDDNNLYVSKLVGFSYDEKPVTEIDSTPGVLSNSIEILKTKLRKEIEIEFERDYEEKPSIIIDIDKKYESLFRTMSREYVIEEKTKTIWGIPETKNVYTGVKLIFNGLKTKNSYPDVSIVIIGDGKVGSVSISYDDSFIESENKVILKAKAYDSKGNLFKNKKIDFYAEGDWDEVDDN